MKTDYPSLQQELFQLKEDQTYLCKNQQHDALIEIEINYLHFDKFSI